MGNRDGLEIISIREGGLEGAKLSPLRKKWADAHKFSGQRGRLLALPGNDGAIEAYLFGLGDPLEPIGLTLGLASAQLAPGTYRLAGDLGDPTMMALGFELGAYRFEKFIERTEKVALAAVEGADWGEVVRQRDAAFLARDLINRPPNDLGPDAFEAEIQSFAKARKMAISVIEGDELLKKNFPMIHAVGRASAEAPRLIDLRWGPEDAPKVTLVGKGVTFDTGGLDIKSPAGMLIMKKDMGGAANVLGLAHAIMDAKLKVRLRVLIPIVENSISGAAFRPGDILSSRAGISVEIGNTDAEGRLILADALAYGDEESPQIIVDMATLTGAARTALGPDLSALYSLQDDFAADLVASGADFADPLWRMPLYAPYERMLASKVATINHVSQGAFAGSITAALFLKKFVKKAPDWAHLDIYGWAPEARPGRAMGGTDQGIRAVYGALSKRYS